MLVLGQDASSGRNEHETFADASSILRHFGPRLLELYRRLSAADQETGRAVIRNVLQTYVDRGLGKLFPNAVLQEFDFQPLHGAYDTGSAFYYALTRRAEDSWNLLDNFHLGELRLSAESRRNRRQATLRYYTAA
jgi:hypothetical protein